MNQETLGCDIKMPVAMYHGRDFSVGHIVLDFTLKLLLFWTDSVGWTLLGSPLYVALCWAVEDILCWALGQWNVLGITYILVDFSSLMESVGH